MSNEHETQTLEPITCDVQESVAPKAPCPIDTLPNELLGAIFVLNAQRSLPAFHNILAISHTCSRWRSIALGCPELWKFYVFLHNKHGPRPYEMTATFLQRCGKLTLDVGWERLASSYQPIAVEVSSLAAVGEFRQIHRFRSYTVLFNDLYYAMASSAPVEPVDALEDITLTTMSAQRFQIFPSRILNSNLHTLKSVTLTHCWVDLNHLRLGNLRTLHICLPRVESELHRYGPVHYLELLKKCSITLEEVHLEISPRVPYTMAESAVPKEETALLPKLTTLTLMLPTSVLHFLFARISAPLLRSIRFETSRVQEDDDRLADTVISRLLTEYILPQKNPVGNRMCVVQSDSSQVINFSPVPEYSSNETEDDSITVAFHHDHVDFSRTMSQWEPVAPFLTSLRANATNVVIVDLFSRIFTSLTYKGRDGTLVIWE
ncbi:hypothetical protein DFP72DRAFT_884761 [Ephemerocybe angulata]|uniref:F-box domain-containing protein n=1 Tax=Ephemerocybe angulata TaxID=980116 RepID=A0A8H6MDE5_9AGAR|nr:hypothetical protein DFP72DRAFT_884761 [Tulosesus angulatus]